MLQASILIRQGRGIATSLLQRAAHLERDWDSLRDPCGLNLGCNP